MLLCVVAVPAMAQELMAPPDCSDFEWDMSTELALFNTGAHEIKAARDAGSAPTVEPNVLYDVVLLPQPGVRFVSSSAARRVVADPQGGLVTFQVPKAGHYRISANGPVWIDVIMGAGPVVASAFNGHARCALIHKSVDFDLPGGVPLLMQFSQSPHAQVRIAITATPVPRDLKP